MDSQVSFAAGELPNRLLARGKNLFDRLSAIAARMGINVAAYTNPELPWFSQLPLEAQERLNTQIGEIVDTMDRPERDLDVLENQVLWSVLHRLKLSFPMEMFEKLPKDGIVEVYTHDHVQVFRSLKFFELCSYSIEEIYARPWYELYSRDTAIEGGYHKAIIDILGNKVSGVLVKPVPKHWVYEKVNGHELRTCIEPLLLFPLFDRSGKAAGYLHVFRFLETQVPTTPVQ